MDDEKQFEMSSKKARAAHVGLAEEGWADGSGKKQRSRGINKKIGRRCVQCSQVW